MSKQKGDSYFGLCPHCHDNDGFINLGRGHWFLCHEHKVMWFIGSNLSAIGETKPRTSSAPSTMPMVSAPTPRLTLIVLHQPKKNYGSKPNMKNG